MKESEKMKALREIVKGKERRGGKGREKGWGWRQDKNKAKVKKGRSEPRALGDRSGGGIGEFLIVMKLNPFKVHWSTFY